MSLFSLLLTLAVICLAVAALFTVGEWVLWVALVSAGVAALVAVTGNDRRVT
jgi:hypothetical protein